MESGKCWRTFAVPYSKLDRGALRWYTIDLPATAVPEKFLVAVWFNAAATKGFFMGKENSDKATHSYAGLPDKGFQKVNQPYEWMIRAVVSPEEGKPPSYPKVTTYAEEKAADTESSEALPMRTWNDATGAFSVEAQFVGVKEGKVMLKKADGKIVAVPLDRLSKEDQDFVAEHPQPGEPAARGERAVARQRKTGRPIEHSGRRARGEVQGRRRLVLRHLGELVRLALRHAQAAAGEIPSLDLQRELPADRHLPLPLCRLRSRQRGVEVVQDPADEGAAGVYRSASASTRKPRRASS